jgi:hypothetical protein
MDLARIEGSGEFKCPRCGIRISPDDMTEDVYTIIETVTKEDCLENLILQCNRCKSIIHLTGFQLLNKIE